MGAKSGQRNSVPTSKFQAPPPPPQPIITSPQNSVQKFYIKNLLIIERENREIGSKRWSIMRVFFAYKIPPNEAKIL